ncbi:4Fe-4S binding protein [Helicobacter cetorum]|uniref:Iron-sulfur cluster-binding domain-containing protein n=1 Tax=Helicobacter cetorum (strain ATCC BAA-540 / CCUG 52418 / MIT 99-5656) TaxID=1163745 RepID=I0ET08_HELCM|nr:4Fe-4S binding protein [Helicobacter cetorum]AFI06077.1 iron-sulfur cluster-binding domain-containing protein [Helicobacter cetorum MIT 99-5656]
MIEFVYVKDPKNPNIILHDHISIEETSNIECVVCNVENPKAKVIAKEVDFLIQNSTQDALELAQSLSVLYEVNALKFDFDNTKISFIEKQEQEFQEVREHFSYNANICQYHKRQTECCAKCTEVCPSLAITKLDKEIALKNNLTCEDNRHLVINHSACIDCAKCISVCPSGALVDNKMNLESFQEISKLYKGYTPLLLDRFEDLENLKINLKKEVLPLCLNLNVLEQTYLLTLLQESGSQIVLFAQELNELSSGTIESIRLLNEIYQAIYKTDAILVASDLESLQTHLNNAQTLPQTHFTPPITIQHTKRDNFSQRISFIVGQTNYKEKTSCGEFIRYGHIEIKDNCTLCLSCVGACNTNALSIDGNNYTLSFNGSLCTTCGYCESICPEKNCLTLFRDGISLEPNYFKPIVLAKDEIFQCKMCSKPIGTQKSVLKIANMMTPIFKDDKRKIAALYACADCKVKIMLEDFLDINSILK